MTSYLRDDRPINTKLQSEKIVELIRIFCSHPRNDLAVAETHFLTHYPLFYLVCYRRYTHSKRCCTPFTHVTYVTGFTRIQGVVSRQSSPNRWVRWLPITWQRWRSHHSIRHFWKPHAIRRLHDCIFYRSRIIAGIGKFTFFLRKIVEIIKKNFALFHWQGTGSTCDTVCYVPNWNCKYQGLAGS